ncbi:MAG: hypothetical protein Q9174_005147 [Haloplaca sp. 1 TL-2023]
MSSKTYVIAGISVRIYGLEELAPEVKEVACLWLLHPRLQTQECMSPLAAATLKDWNQRDQSRPKGLLAVSFDQRNHGSREIDPLANEAWRSGNERHAQDMFSIYHGTATDTSLLITYISSYIFPSSEREITTNLVLGISLGGHAAWQCLFHDPRISAAVIVIGCPDYLSLMSDRARLSKLLTWTESNPAGACFLGSKDFPLGLAKAVELYDPAGMMLKSRSSLDELDYGTPSAEELTRLLPLMKRSLEGKRILNLSGGEDKLVPHRCSQPFIQWLKSAIAPNGWFANGAYLEDVVLDGVGHQMSPDMVTKAISFVTETVNGTVNTPVAKKSKM